MHNVIATRSSRAITTVDVTAIVVSIDLQQRSSSCENSVHLHQPEERVVPCGTLRGKRLREWVNLRVGVGVGDVVVAVGVGVVRFNFLFIDLLASSRGLPSSHADNAGPRDAGSLRRVAH